MAKVVNLELDPNANTDVEFDWFDCNTNLAIDVTDYSAHMQVRAKPYDVTVLLEFSTTNGKIILGGTTGTITVKFAPSDLNTGNWFSGVYDLYVTNLDDASVTAVAKGFITLYQQVTQ